MAVKESKNKKIRLLYTSPAFPPFDINMKKMYLLDKDNDGTFVSDGEKKIKIDYELIKTLFTPIGVTWEELDKDTKK